MTIRKANILTTLAITFAVWLGLVLFEATKVLVYLVLNGKVW